MTKQKEKKELIEKYKIHEKDTGSSEIQIALLTEKITELVLHLKKHPKDFSSKRGLLKIVAQRKRLLKYLKDENKRRYGELTKKLGLKE